MRSLTVTRRIEAPAESVFDLLADHANYDRFRGMNSSELVREGDPPPNGVGALRRIHSRPFRFDEEITAYERPSLLGYLIVKVNAPLEHDGGLIRLREEGGATDVEWSTKFRVPTPLVGGLQERIWAIALRRGFGRVLADIDRTLRSG